VILSGELRPTALFDFLGQCAHGFASDLDTFAAGNGGLRKVDSGETLRTLALLLDPKRQRCLHSFFSALKPAALDGLSDKILLLGSEVYLHTANIMS